MSKSPLISGIQQIGIGNASVYDTWEWYRKNLGFDVPVFDEAAEASLMLPYTGGKPRKRHAVLALNMMGGAGAEIWQYVERTPEAPRQPIEIGDLGINIAKYKSKDIAASFQALKGEDILSKEINKDPFGQNHFYLKDKDGNLIEIVESDNWFQQKGFHCGGVYGASIGVTDMEASLLFYKNILNYDEILSDESGQFEDLSNLSGGTTKFRRVLLTHSKPRSGPFSKLFGNSQIELFQAIDKKPNLIFQDRLWGDLGYIHLCFDISGIDAMRAKCKSNGHPFTVDSGDFDMGDAAGHFAYIEDPDGTLIEFVETHKVPILKKIGWSLDLKARNPQKDLPRWMIKALGFQRKKNPVNV